jgi:peroxiredoxin
MSCRTSRFATALIAVAALCLAVPAWSGEDEEWVGKPAPNFELKDLQGQPLHLAELQGKHVVWLNFWGLRCGPCVRELPVLEKLYQKYKDKGLLIIGLNADGVDADFIAKQFEAREDLKAAGVTFPLAPDMDFAVIDAYGLLGAPLNVMIDRKGVVQFRHEGYEDGDEVHYVKVLEKLLGQ